jgi:phosphatidate cytidylyltransferase
MLKRRVVTGILLSAVSLVCIFVKPLFVAVAVVLIALGLYEIFTLMEKKGVPMYKYFGITLGIIIPLSTYLRFQMTKGWELLFISLALGTMFVLQFSRRQSTNAVLGISGTIFGIFYIAWFFNFLIKVRMMDHGLALAGFVILVTKGADIGAFVVGSRWGRHSLIPRISPNKTVEGAVGAVVFAAVLAVASKIFLPDWLVFSVPNLVILGVVMGALAILGDLSESLIKRDCGVKDSGNLLPGMGGILDAIDSLLFVAPAFYFFINFYMSRVFASGTTF